MLGKKMRLHEIRQHDLMICLSHKVDNILEEGTMLIIKHNKRVIEVKVNPFCLILL